MINFNYEYDIDLSNEKELRKWIEYVIRNEGKQEGEIEYIFVTDVYLHQLNVKFLNHDTLTDIITFDNSLGNLVSGDIFISIDRVQENSTLYEVSLLEELYRVMVHGILHLCGHHDKTTLQQKNMRQLENHYLSYFSEGSNP